MYDEAVKGGFVYPDTLDGWIGPEWASFSRRRNPQRPRLQPAHLQKLNNLEPVLNARYPPVADLKIRAWHKRVLHTLGSWRYQARVYNTALGLRAMFKLISYTSPERAGL